METWYSPAVVPPLIERLHDNRTNVGHEAIKLLGKLCDDRALEPLMGRLKEDGFQVHDALKSFGPGAEPALIRMLTSPDTHTRRMACDILRDIGGMETLIAMRDLPPDSDLGVRHTAQRAWDEIVRRVGPPPPAEKKGKSATTKGRPKS